MTPWTAACQAILSFTISDFAQTHVNCVDDATQPFHLSPPFLLALSLFQHQCLFFSNESAFHIRWPKYWSFSFSINPSNECSELISCRIDWSDLLAIQGTLKSLLQHHRLKASILRHSAFFMVQRSHPYMTTGKTIDMTIWISVGKVTHCLGLS